MKVLLASDYFPPHVGGGVEEVTFHMAEKLTELGHQVVVLTLNTCSASAVENLDGIRVYRAALVELTNALGAQSAVSTELINLMRNVCRKEQPNVLHANNLYFYTTLAACLNLDAVRLPLVTTLHIGSVSELEGFVRYAAKLYELSVGRWIVGRSNRVVAVSEAVKRYAVELGVEPCKISVVPNGVDTVKFHPSSAVRNGDGLVRVGFVGRLVANKGPQYLVEAASRIVHDFPNVRFQVAGRGPMLPMLQRRAQELGIKDVFRFFGTVPSMVEFMQSCDIMVRPSVTDGMPLTVLEAMACGLPTVASRVGGTPEILEESYSGYLVRPKDVDQLVLRISQLVADARLRAEMGSRARQFVERYSDWSDIAKRMIPIYEIALSS